MGSLSGVLLGLARSRIRKSCRQVADEEDIANDVFMDFYEDAKKGRFEELHHRDELWRLLLVITHHRAVDHARHFGRQKRTPPEASLERLFDSSSSDFDALESREPPPELMTLVDDQIDLLLNQLRTDVLRQVALFYLEGQDSESISKRLQLSQRTVQRKIKLIRSKWAKELQS